MRSNRSTLLRDTAPPAAGSFGPQTGRRRVRRLTTGSIVPVVLAVLAAGFGYEALQDRSAMTSIVVASSRLPAGSPVNAGDTRVVSVHATDTDLTHGLLHPADMAQGWVAAVTVQAGGPLTWSEVKRASRVRVLGQMSIAVPVQQAVGGRISAGELVDVIASNGTGGAHYVAQALHVVSVAPTSGAGNVLGGGAASYFVVVAVDKQTALQVAAALGSEGAGGANSQIEVVSSTGEAATGHLRYGASPSGGTGTGAGKVP